MLRIAYQDAYDVLLQKLLAVGLDPERAELSAGLFVDASRDGVPSHGLNRFPGFIESVRKGIVDIQARPRQVASLGALERWDGQRGPGNLNAHDCMQRAIALAREFGLGGVALANTNHWMRGGNYGWQAAEAGMIAICWTNTMPNLPPWGSSRRLVGNNPLVIAVPRAAGHVVLDMAMAQFSFGVMSAYARRNEQLPVPGGFDSAGQLTRDPQAIFDSGRTLPIGYWKGSGLALVLDLIGSLLSGGHATHQIGADPAGETSVSQVFLALNPHGLDEEQPYEAIVDQIVAHFQGADPAGAERVYYPGERSMENRVSNMELGIPVEPETWQKIQAL